MKARTFKRCACVDADTNKPRGTRCPKLRRRNGSWSADHGRWHYQVELPQQLDGTRRPFRRGGFSAVDDAQAEIDRIGAILAMADRNDTEMLAALGDAIVRAHQSREPLPTPDAVRKQLQARANPGEMPTVGQWLDSWIAGRKKIRKSTAESYARHIRLWLKPELGHHDLDKLTIDHVTAMFDKIAERNDAIQDARDSDNPQIRDSVRNVRITGPATMHRYRATLRKALNDAIRARKIGFNPSLYVELPSGKRPKALLWTAERVRRWKETGKKPSRVMVWMPDHTGRFLDHAADDPLYPLFHLIAFRGLRRGEACGLPWWQTDLTAQTITISSALVQIGWKTELGEVKSEASGRVVFLDNETNEVLREHRQRQQQLRAARNGDNEVGLANGLVFTQPDGTPYHPAHVSERFEELVAEAGLPPVRLHDLRHGAATLTLATGADLKIVQELLGHSSITITADTYAHVLPELAQETAEAAAALVPRKALRQLPPAA